MYSALTPNHLRLASGRPSLTTTPEPARSPSDPGLPSPGEDQFHSVTWGMMCSRSVSPIAEGRRRWPIRQPHCFLSVPFLWLPRHLSTSCRALGGRVQAWLPSNATHPKGHKPMQRMKGVGRRGGILQTSSSLQRASLQGGGYYKVPLLKVWEGNFCKY